MQASIKKHGVQFDETWIIPPGKWFNDRVLETFNYILYEKNPTISFWMNAY